METKTIYPKVSIITLNWNGLEDTVKCLDSLKEITYPNYEVIVVDNGSKGNDTDILEEKYGDYIRLIRNKENLGFSGGNNLAMRKVLKERESNYILLLNNDTVVNPEFLTELVKVIEDDSSVGAVTPKIFNSDGSLQRGVRKFPSLFLTFLSFCVPKIFLSNKVKNFIAKTNFKKLLGERIGSYFWSFELGEPVEIENASGACLLVRNKTIKQVGMLDEKIPLGPNDIDWCLRIKQNNWKIIYVPKSKIIHYVSGSFKTKVEKCIYFCYTVLNEYYYAKKHHNKINIFKTKAILLFALSIKLPRFLYYYLRKEKKSSDLWSVYQSTINKIITE